MGVPTSVPSLSGAAARLEALGRYAILHTPPEAAFDRIASLAARLFQMPNAAIVFFERDRLWAKAWFGPEIPDFRTETPFCERAFLAGSVLVVPDARQEAGLSALAAVRAGNICFFAAAPLRTPAGVDIGALCLFDSKPRRLRSDERTILADLAAEVMQELGRRVPGPLQADAGSAVETDWELRARIRQQAVVSQLGQHALAGNDLAALMDEAVQLVAQTLDVDFCKLLELLPDGETLLLRAGVGWKPGLVGKATFSSRSGSQGGYALLASEPVIVEDLQTDSRFSGTGILHQHGVRSGVTVIIHGGRRPFGIIGAHTRTLRRFNHHDIHFLQSVANVLGAAIQRKFAEQALERANHNLRTVLHTVPLPVIAIDLEGNVKLWNPAAERVFGWTETEVLNGPVPTIPEAEREEFRTLLDAYRKGGSISGVERRRQRKDGSTVDVMLWTAGLYNDNGEINGTLGVFVDITDRKRFEAALRHSESLDAVCEIVQSQTPGLLCSIQLIDQTGEWLKVHAAPSFPPSFTEALGAFRIGPEAGSCGTAIWRRQTVAVTDVMTDPLWSNFREIASRFGLRSCWATPLLSSSGQVLGSLALYSREPRAPSPQDIHLMERAAQLAAAMIERTRAAQELRDSEERYRRLFEENPLPIIIGGHDGRTVDANEAALELFGYGPGETPTLSDPALYADIRDQQTFFHELYASGSVRDFETTLLKKNGERMDCLITATVRQLSAAQGLQYQAIIRDVTGRKRAERNVLELSGRLLRMQDEERRKIARELHDSTAQTLAALAMNISVIENEVGPGLDSRPRKLLRDARALAVQCSRELRTISHLLHPPLLDELGLASAVRSYASGFANRSGISVDLDIADGLGRLPRDVETALFRVIQESLTNIHKHSGSPTARIKLSVNGALVQVSISDHGRGIPPSLLAGRGGGCVGVGLAGMRERVRQLGGRLDIESGPGGATIKAELPLAADAAA